MKLLHVLLLTCGSLGPGLNFVMPKYHECGKEHCHEAVAEHKEDGVAKEQAVAPTIWNSHDPFLKDTIDQEHTNDACAIEHAPLEVPS
eukprot:3836437-Amphidinium_carterae.1